jgi:hypothetical protein
METFPSASKTPVVGEFADVPIVPAVPEESTCFLCQHLIKADTEANRIPLRTVAIVPAQWLWVIPEVKAIITFEPFFIFGFYPQLTHRYEVVLVVEGGVQACF